MVFYINPHMGAGDRYYSSFVHKEVEASRNAFVNGRNRAAFDGFGFMVHVSFN